MVSPTITNSVNRSQAVEAASAQAPQARAQAKEKSSIFQGFGKLVCAIRLLPGQNENRDLKTVEVGLEAAEKIHVEAKKIQETVKELKKEEKAPSENNPEKWKDNVRTGLKIAKGVLIIGGIAGAVAMSTIVAPLSAPIFAIGGVTSVAEIMGLTSLAATATTLGATAATAIVVTEAVLEVV